MIKVVIRIFIFKPLLVKQVIFIYVYIFNSSFLSKKKEREMLTYEPFLWSNIKTKHDKLYVEIT